MNSDNQTLTSNISCISTVCKSLSTSLGPRGLDKLLIADKKSILTNDGATILKTMSLEHPSLKILSNLSSSQDSVCGDGTTSVVLLCGAILESATKLDITRIRNFDEILQKVKDEALSYLKQNCVPVGDNQKESVMTCLSSKVVSGYSELIAEIAVEAVKSMGNVKDIKILKKIGGAIENIKLVKGVALSSEIKNPECFHENKTNDLNYKNLNLKYRNLINDLNNNEILIGEKICKTAFIQFCISSPKTDLDSRVLIRNEQVMQKFIDDEKKYVLNLCKRIKDAGIELLVIQKSILRESLSAIGLHFLKQMDILVIDDVDRKEMEHLCKVFNASVISDISLIKSCGLFKIREVESFGSKITTLEKIDEHFDKKIEIVNKELNNLKIENSEKTNFQESADNSNEGEKRNISKKIEQKNNSEKIEEKNNSIKIDEEDNSIKAKDENNLIKSEKTINTNSDHKELKTKNPISIVIRGGDSILIDEIERSVHDGLCVAKSLIDLPFLVAGGGTMEMGIAKQLLIKEGTAVEKMCYREFGRAFEMIPFYLARNAGMDPILILDKLRNSDKLGVCVKNMDVCDMFAQNVIQPLKVTESMVCGAIETAIMILKIDDMLPCRR
ncbi:T-complex protein 1 subunit delta [Dictyocoela muelleri]|nr:T-complex protein 1 subunit delta [Dictyocoela muelleri]